MNWLRRPRLNRAVQRVAVLTVFSISRVSGLGAIFKLLSKWPARPLDGRAPFPGNQSRSRHGLAGYDAKTSSHSRVQSAARLGAIELCGAQVLLHSPSN